MTIDYLQKILEHRISYLQALKQNAEIAGNIEEINKLDEELLTTQTTLNQLRNV